MKICLAQLNPTIGDLEGNTQKILNAIDQGRANGSDLILFPEMAICGYLPADLLLKGDFIKAVQDHLQTIVEHSKDIAVVVGLPRANVGKGKPLHNSAAIVFDGQILGYYDKCLLPNYNVFDERRYFTPGKKLPTFNLFGKKVAIIICEDIWQHSGYVESPYPFDPIEELVKEKPDLLLNLSASPYQFDKPDMRVEVCAKAASTLDCPVLLCCQIGGNDDLIFDGYSVYVDQLGELKQLGKGFEEDLVWIDLEAPSCSIPFHYDPIADLFSALRLGLKDYFSKQGFQKAILGLSGGIDSALVAAIAKEALGAENILAVAMPSRYSSKESVIDAKELCQNLDIAYKEISIDSLFGQALLLLEPHFEGRKSDTTEENIQARLRGLVLMALSNKFGHLVLSTGNKSEMAVGYCTLYGDMAGGLGVISDVLKTQVYELCRWVNRESEVIPKRILEKPPSAELRPDQCDLDSLPDYQIVDTVVSSYVEGHKSLEQIVSEYQIDKKVASDLIHKLHSAEYKRRQAAPGLRVSQVAFSVGRRFPIVQKWDKIES